MDFQVGCIDNDCLLFTKARGVANTHLIEDAIIALARPTVVGSFVNPKFPVCIALPQVIAIDENAT